MCMTLIAGADEASNEADGSCSKLGEPLPSLVATGPHPA